MGVFSVQGSLLNKNGVNLYGGLLGFSDFCSIYPLNLNDKSVRRNGYVKQWRILASSSSRGNSSSKSVNEGERYGMSFNHDDFGGDDDDEVDDDDLSCFRGLVLDISYRFVVLYVYCLCVIVLVSCFVIFYVDYFIID